MPTPQQYDELALVIFHAGDSADDYGQTAFRSLMERLVDDIARVFTSDPAFDRKRFCAKCGFPLLNGEE